MPIKSDSTHGHDEPTKNILQTLLCMLREKNVLSRADIEDLCERVAMRATQADRDPIPCCNQAATAAAAEMAQVGDYIGRHYGGKHLRRPHN